jgi:hypothetical protein
MLEIPHDRAISEKKKRWELSYLFTYQFINKLEVNKKSLQSNAYLDDVLKIVSILENLLSIYSSS